MAKVRESRQHRMIVVRHRPILKWSLRFLTVAAIVGAGAGGYVMGFKLGATEQVRLEKMVAEQAQRAHYLETNNVELSQQLINIKTGAEVDRKASEAVRQELLDLKTLLQKTQGENDLYRNNMSPGSDAKGPVIGDWEVSASGADRQYSFKLTVKQLAKHTDWVKGDIDITLEGTENGASKSYRYRDIAILDEQDDSKQDRLEATKLKVRFRYFQNLAGTFALPSNFLPQQVTITLNLEGNKNKTTTESYDWLAP